MATTARPSVPPELAVAALVGAASLPLARLFQSGGLGGVVLLSLAASLAVSWGTRRLRVPPGFAWVVSMVALVWFLSIRFFSDTLALVIPTGETFQRLGVALRDGAQHIYTDAAPVEPIDPILLYVAGGVWLTVWLVDAAAILLETPLLGVASALPLFLIAGALLPSDRLWLEAAIFLGAAAWLLFNDQRRRAQQIAPGSLRAGWRAGRALWLATVAALAAVSLGPLLPGYGTPPGLQGRGGGSQVVFNPMVAIKPTLDETVERTLFFVRTTDATYHRLTAVEHFDGRMFAQRESSEVVPALAEPAYGVDLKPLRSRYRIHALGGPWLPAPFQALSYEGPGEGRLEESTAAVLTPQSVTAGSLYTIVSASPRPTWQLLDGPVAYDREAFAAYLQLPRDVARRVRPIARDIAGGEPTPFRQAVALQEHLRRFTYDDRIAAGHSFDDIVEFLTEVRRGYCEQFAASMAVLARALGIPSRVAIGFGPGESEGNGIYRVTTKDAHAWVELFFPQAGWVAFEPTPRDGIARPPGYTVAPADVAPRPSDDPDPLATATAQPTNAPRPLDPADAEDPAQSGAGGGSSVPAWVIPVSVVSALALLPLGLAMLLSLRRRRRLRAATSPQQLVAARYVDFVEWCAATGLGRLPGETPREHAGRLGSVTAEARAPLGELAVLVEEALWAPPNGLDPTAAAAATERAKAALTPTIPRWRRVLAWIGWRPRPS